jgi:hypothetical protein
MNLTCAVTGNFCSLLGFKLEWKVLRNTFHENKNISHIEGTIAVLGYGDFHCSHGLPDGERHNGGVIDTDGHYILLDLCFKFCIVCKGICIVRCEGSDLVEAFKRFAT